MRGPVTPKRKPNQHFFALSLIIGLMFGETHGQDASSFRCNGVEWSRILSFLNVSFSAYVKRFIQALVHLESSLDMSKPTPIPITVFIGFLGAGKTSIILSLLPQLPKDYKVVLLKNEFGDVEGKSSKSRSKFLT